MKKYLLSLFVGFVGFVSFGYCQELPVISYGVNNLCESSSSDPSYRFAGVGYFCYDLSSDGNWINNYPSFRFYSDYTNTYSFYLDIINGISNTINSSISSCIYVSQQNAGLLIQGYNGRCWDFEFNRSNSSSCDDPYTSLECQTEYNLIPVNDVDINYCVRNQLCPSCDLSGGNSELFINDIQHISAPLININIPEEFDWDYTGNDEEFLLDVKGYNVDTEYISSIITTQNSKPNNIDFNNIVSGLIPLLVPGLVLIAFIYFVFRFVKKIF